MRLSKTDEEVYETLKKSKLSIFRIRDLCLLLNIDKTKAYNVIKSLKNKGAIKNVGKGFFSLFDTDDYIIGSAINWPSYLSFLSALNYYNLSDNVPNKIFYVTTKYTKDYKNFKYVTLANKRFFGYLSIGDLIIAEREKAIIDSLLFPKYSGGIKEIIKSFNDEIDYKKLIDYGIKIESKVVLRRLGFILEMKGYKNLGRIEKLIGKGYILLDPNLKKKNNYNKKWLLDVNI